MAPATRHRRMSLAGFASAVLVLLMGLARGAFAATDTVDFVTLPGNCQQHIDDQGNGKDPQLQAGLVTIELWSDFIENASTVSSSVNGVTATVGAKRNGATNVARGCPLKGSVEVKVSSPPGLPADQIAVLTVNRSDTSSSNFVQQVKIKAVPQLNLTFKGTDSLSCLGAAGGVQFLENNKRLQIQLPQGAATDLSNCNAPVTLLISNPTPPPFVQATTSFGYSLSSTLAQQKFVAKGGAQLVGSTGLGGVPIRLTVLPVPVFVQVSNPPTQFSPPPAPQPSTVGYVPQFGFQIQLNALNIRKTAVLSRLTLTATAPNGLTDSVNIDVLPPPTPTGIESGGASPQTVDVGNTVDITAIFAHAAPSNGETLTYRITTPGCFVFADTGAALPTTRGLVGVGTVQLPAGLGAIPGVTLLTLRANNPAADCVGIGTPPTTASQKAEVFVGDFAADPNVINIPAGPNHLVIPFSIRKSTP
jgi:hypothetical protein